MSIRDVPILLFLCIGPLGCSEYDAYVSERVKSMSAEGRQLIVLMDRVSKEYATCSAYFQLAPGYLERSGTGQAKDSDAWREYERRHRIALNLTEITTRVGRSSRDAEMDAGRRINHYNRHIRGYYDESDPSWEEVRGEFDARCNSATQDVAGTITNLLSHQQDDTFALCNSFPIGSDVSRLHLIADRYSLELMTRDPPLEEPEARRLTYCASFSMCDFACSLDVKDGLVIRSEHMGPPDD